MMAGLAVLDNVIDLDHHLQDTEEDEEDEEEEEEEEGGDALGGFLAILQDNL